LRRTLMLKNNFQQSASLVFINDRNYFDDAHC